MKIAVLADIHGNYTALKAVLEDAKKQNVTKYIIAGDHIGDGPQPSEVVSEIMGMKECCVIKGNKEEKVLGYHLGKYSDWTDILQVAVFVWTSKQLNQTQVEYLNSLPIQDVLKINESMKIRVVHGSPTKADDTIDKDNGERIQQILDEIDEQVLIFGHSHIPKRVDYKCKVAINPGSVGLSFNQDARAEYAILQWDGSQWHSEQRYVEYSKEELKQQFYESKLIEYGGAWAKATLQSMQQGKDIAILFLRQAYQMTRQRGINSFLVPNDIWKELEQKWDWES